MEKKQLSKEQIEEIFAGTGINGDMIVTLYLDLLNFSDVGVAEVESVCSKHHIAITKGEVIAIATNFVTGKQTA